MSAREHSSIFTVLTGFVHICRNSQAEAHLKARKRNRVLSMKFQWNFEGFRMLHLWALPYWRIAAVPLALGCGEAFLAVTGGIRVAGVLGRGWTATDSPQLKANNWLVTKEKTDKKGELCRSMYLNPGILQKRAKDPKLRTAQKVSKILRFQPEILCNFHCIIALGVLALPFCLGNKLWEDAKEISVLLSEDTLAKGSGNKSYGPSKTRKAVSARVLQWKESAYQGTSPTCWVFCICSPPFMSSPVSRSNCLFSDKGPSGLDFCTMHLSTIRNVA